MYFLGKVNLEIYPASSWVPLWVFFYPKEFNKITIMVYRKGDLNIDYDMAVKRGTLVRRHHTIIFIISFQYCH